MMKLRWLCLVILIFSAASCDHRLVKFQRKNCYYHPWKYRGVYRVLRTYGTQVFMERVPDGRRIEIDDLDEKWKWIDCKKYNTLYQDENS